MGETAPLENARWMSHARQALQRKTRSVGRAARGEGEPQIPIKPQSIPMFESAPFRRQMNSVPLASIEVLTQKWWVDETRSHRARGQA